MKFVGSSGEIFWISQSVGGWVSDLEIAIASPSFASLFYVSLYNALLCGRLRGVKDEVKQTRRAQSRPEGPPTFS